MQFRIILATVQLVLSIVPVHLENYDLIIIPIPKGRIKTNSVPDRTDTFLPRHKKHYRKDHVKLDIEQYGEPTDTPDIDSFDYNIDRSEFKIIRSKNDETSDYDFNYGDDKIVGGVEVDINLYPYHVAYGTNCGGTIIDRKWVMTAGHCGKKPYVRVGSKYIYAGKKILVKRNVIHPNWYASQKEHAFDFDYQLLELSEPLKFNINIQPVKIGRIEDMVIGTVVSVTGWGNTAENGPYSNVLRAVRVPIISKEHCQTVSFPYFKGSLTARMFCAGFVEGKKDACQGDSGGPAVANGRLLGMVSFGYGCATPGSYGVYSKVAKVRDWIKSVTGLRLD